jgi:MFS family permease
MTIARVRGQSGVLGRLRGIVRAARIDVGPLRRYRDFRLLFCASAVSLFGSFVTMVAAPLQMKRLTDSFVAVGLIGVAEFVPLVTLGLWGGAVADAYDRRRVVVIAQLAELAATAGLLANAVLPRPHSWVIFVAAALAAAGVAVRRPSQDALAARLVAHEDQPAANALRGIEYNLGAVVAPGLGGLVATYSMPLAYGIDAATFVVALSLLVRMQSPAAGAREPVSISGIGAGIRYAVGRRDLLGTYLVDIVAMTFAMPEAVFPFLADTLHEPRALGLLYSAGAVGGILAALSSGWTRRVHRHGMAIAFAAAGWGAALALAGLTTQLVIVLACLATAGFADEISGIFRMTMWNQTVPDELRGRLAGIELLSYTSGPSLGNARAGAMGQLAGVRFSIGVGGLLCVFGVAITTACLPAFRRYDARTDPHTAALRRP